MSAEIPTHVDYIIEAHLRDTNPNSGSYNAYHNALREQAAYRLGYQAALDGPVAGLQVAIEDLLRAGFDGAGDYIASMEAAKRRADVIIAKMKEAR